MILVRTPLRISFAGGMSDIPSYYKEHGGAVLNAAIDKYVYIVVKDHFSDEFLLKYSQTENVTNSKDIKHPLIKETMKYFDIKGGVEMGSFGDIPTNGTGLGSSSSFTVGLVHAIQKHSIFKNYGIYGECPVNQIVDMACDIELSISDIGKQDQHAAAYGGLNLFEWSKDDSSRFPIVIPPQLEDNLLLFFTGDNRDTNKILNNFDTFDHSYIKELVNMSYLMTAQLKVGDIDGFGKGMDKVWELKKKASSLISTKNIDAMYNTAKEAGAYGGKICGAGGGGFLLLYVPKENHQNVREALKDYKELHFKFDTEGSKVLYEH